MAKSITKRTLVGFRNIDVHAKFEADLIEKLSDNEKREQLIKKLQNGKTYWKISKDNMIQFDAIVGNPPYQVMQTTEKTTSSQGALAGAIYPLFIDLACDLSPYYVSLITPSRWMTKAGRGISDDWVDNKLNSDHFICIHDYPNANDVFNRVEIKGGVNYFLYSNSYKGKCDFILHKNNHINVNNTQLNSVGAGIVIRDPEAFGIINKVKCVEGSYFGEKSFASMVASGTLFCDCAKGILNTSWRGYVLEPDEDHNIKYYLNKGLVKKGYAWIKKADMIKAFDTVDLHKVYIPKAGGSGSDPIVLGNPFYGEPGSICSQTYICIGFDPKIHNLSKDQCMNVISYIKTRFFRYMVSIKKKTQDAFSQVYEFVPMQDFSEPWTDDKLYAKYGITATEQAYIESLIKPMD